MPRFENEIGGHKHELPVPDDYLLPKDLMKESKGKHKPHATLPLTYHLVGSQRHLNIRNSRLGTVFILLTNYGIFQLTKTLSAEQPGRKVSNSDCLHTRRYMGDKNYEG